MFFCFLLTGLGLLLKLRLLLELLEGDLRLFLLFSRFRGIGLADVETLRPRRVGGEFLLLIKSVQKGCKRLKTGFRGVGG